MTGYIDSIDDLRSHYAAPGERTLKKQLARLDGHCRNFIQLSPFVVVATANGAQLDASPRGGAPGFVKVVDDVTLWLPDSPGNNRLDTLANIVASGRAGLLFLIPGVDETLRINGAARISVDPAKLAHFATEKRTPRVVVEITVEEAFLHCAKALMRSRLWADEARQDRGVLPTMGQMLADHIGDGTPVETQEQMIARYQRDL
ncbi:MAG TPA: pyridoxamine 5'-phosphate oxidase family protein [Thermoanaerobaculia bacterium]